MDYRYLSEMSPSMKIFLQTRKEKKKNKKRKTKIKLQ